MRLAPDDRQLRRITAVRPKHTLGSGQTRLTNVAGDDIAPDWQPATTADCKNGAWQNLVDDQGRPFKNQGDCVSFV
jgi:hypothetical protein